MNLIIESVTWRWIHRSSDSGPRVDTPIRRTFRAPGAVRRNGAARTIRWRAAGSFAKVRGMRALGLYAIAAMLVRLADAGARVALTLLAVERTGSAALGGALIAVLLVPHVAVAPAIGMLVDRIRRPGWVVAGAAVLFGTALALAAASVGRAPTPLVLGVLLVGGCGGPALTGGLSSRLADLVPARWLPRAGGLDSVTYNVAGIAGPALAAVLVGTFSASAATLALAGCAAAGAVLVALLPIRRHGDPPPAFRAADLLAGARVVAAEPTLRVVTIATTIEQVGAGAVPVAVASIAVAAGNPASAGWLLTAASVGGLAGGLLWTWRPAPGPRCPAVVMAGMAGVALPLLPGAALPTHLPVLLAVFVLSGIADGPMFGATLQSRQELSPPGLRSQVFTISAGLKITAAAGGAALAGALTGLPPGAQLALAASMPLLGAVLGAATLPRQPRQLRQLRLEAGAGVAPGDAAVQRDDGAGEVRTGA